MQSPESGSQDCQHCGTAVDSLANFCPQCGTRVGDDRFCPSCGEPFGSDDEFCSDCGHARPNPASDRGSVEPRHGETHAAFRQRVRDHIEAGWELKNDQGDQVTLVDRGIGSIPIHVLLLLVGGGIWNLIYGWYHYSVRAETRFLSAGDSRQTHPPGVETAAQTDSDTNDTLTTVTSYLLGGFLSVISLFLFELAIDGRSLIVGIFALWFALGGLVYFPPFKRRLARRHSLTKFGRQKTVDHRIVYPHEEYNEPCVVCGKHSQSGLLRRRRDETLVAGVPLFAHRLDHNFYCKRCASEDLLGGGVDADTTAEEAQMSTAELN